MTAPKLGLRPELEARVRLRDVLRDARALGADEDMAGSVAVAAASRLLREGCRDVARTECWAGVLRLWVLTRTREGLL
jgi:hypothetical protein